MSEQNWVDRIESKLSRANHLRSDVIELERFLYMDLQEGRLNREGRMTLSTQLEIFARIEPPTIVRVAGMNWRIEIWSKPVWQSLPQQTDRSYLDVLRLLDEPDVTATSPDSSRLPDLALEGNS